MLAIGVVLIVLIFKTSDALAAAYGIAVTGVMVISTFLVAIVAVRRWRWKLPHRHRRVRHAWVSIDLAFLSANSLKIVQGGWLPLAMAARVFVLIDTWRVGRRVHHGSHARRHPADRSVPGARDKTPARVAGTAMFLAPRTDVTPGPLLHSLKHYKVLHERVVIASIAVEDMPFVPPERRVEVTKLGKGFFEVKIHLRLLRNARCAARA